MSVAVRSVITQSQRNSHGIGRREIPCAILAHRAKLCVMNSGATYAAAPLRKEITMRGRKFVSLISAAVLTFAGAASAPLSFAGPTTDASVRRSRTRVRSTLSGCRMRRSSPTTARSRVIQRRASRRARKSMLKTRGSRSTSGTSPPGTTMHCKKSALRKRCTATAMCSTALRPSSPTRRPRSSRQ